MEDQEQFVCPRNTFGDQFGKAHWDVSGKYRVCSHCGSMHPDEVTEAIKTYGPQIVEASTKNYKKYIRIPDMEDGPKKFYGGHFTHFTEEQTIRYNQALKDWIGK